MGGFIGVILVFGITGGLMVAMWRQMRRVRSYSAERSREQVVVPPPAEPEFEEFDSATGHYLRHPAEVNPNLIKQGARARQSGWYLEP